jgi:hypothetical protein
VEEVLEPVEEPEATDVDIPLALATGTTLVGEAVGDAAAAEDADARMLE